MRVRAVSVAGYIVGIMLGDVVVSTGRRPALSPSRAGDFKQCPLLYRFRAIDRLPEVPTKAQVRGTVVHAVLERLYGLPAAERSPEAAAALVPVEVERFYAEDAGAEVVPEEGREEFTADARKLVATLYSVEEPRRFSPESCESHVVTATAAGTPLHGYLDRIDVAPTGEVRIVDYKTGRSPSEFFEAKAMFQMKFYALVVWRTRGVIPRMLQVVYLGNAEMLRYEPDERDLLATERKVEALWTAIRRAQETGEWRPNKSRLCDWCDHKAICPAWGGTPPPLPPLAPEPASVD